MDANNIETAPQISDVATIYDRWKQSHSGDFLSFFDFMTRPETDRDAFVNGLHKKTLFYGSAASTIIEDYEN